MGLGELLIILFILVFGLGGFAFWLWMLIDCASKDESDDKVVWLVIIVLAGWIGALVYFFVRRRPRVLAER